MTHPALKRRPSSSLVAVVVALALIAAACGSDSRTAAGSDSDGDGDAAPTTASADDAEETSTGSETTESQPVETQTTESQPVETPSTDTKTTETQTSAEPSEADDEESGEAGATSGARELTTAIAGNGDFGFEEADEECLTDGIAATLSDTEIDELLMTMEENLEPGDPLTDSVIAVYEAIGSCLGGERALTVLLEPEVDSRPYDCAIAAFDSEMARIDLAVGLMAVFLADLPVAPGRYGDVVDTFTLACEAEVG